MKVVSRAGWGLAAGAVYAVGATVLLGVRSRRHKTATGSTGFLGVRSRGGPARAAAGSLAGALALGAAAPVLAALTAPRCDRWPAVARWGGTALAIGGLALTWRAQEDMGRSWRIGVDPDERTELVSSGLFASVRNPIFTGMILAQLGTVLMAPTRLGTIGVGLLIAGCETQVRAVEEPYLIDQHGDDYRRYAAGAGRFAPGLGRLEPLGSAEARR